MIRLLLILFLLAPVARAQEDTNAPPRDHYLVKFYGANTNSYPVFWPAAVTSCDSNAVAVEPWHLFSQEQFDELKATNAAAFKMAQDAKHAALKIKMDANLARILELFQQIPAGRTSMTNTMNATISNVAQASAHIKTLANVMDKILEELQRLGPVLKEIYRPESDVTP